MLCRELGCCKARAGEKRQIGPTQWEMAVIWIRLVEIVTNGEAVTEELIIFRNHRLYGVSRKEMR